MGKYTDRLYRRLWKKRQRTQMFHLSEQMREKDAELLESIKSVSVAEGIRRWRLKYPKDFSSVAEQVDG